MKVGVVGLGGLGHMGVKFSHALGAHTVMITTTAEKGEDAKHSVLTKSLSQLNPIKWPSR